MIEIQLTRGQVTVIDNCDADLAELNWCARPAPNYADSAYRAVHNVWHAGHKCITQHMHRVILSRALGRELQRGELVDHINGNPLDNRRENLRLATNSENMRNRGKNANNTSGFKGVSWHKGTRKWRAYIGLNGKVRHIGLFDNPAEAARAYDAAAREMHGAFARLNFPSPAEQITNNIYGEGETA